MSPRVLRVFAVIGVVATLAGLAAGVVLFAMIRKGFSTREAPSALEEVVARQLRSWATPGSIRDLQNPLPVTEEILSSAREHWADHCAGCHGNDGRGQTPLGRSLFPRSPDMRGTRTQSLTDGQLYGIIENGIRLTGMPGWGDGAPANRDSWELVAFIRHLPNQTETELEQMRAMNPKSMHELREAHEEDEFLNAPAGADEKHRHQGVTK